MNREKIVVIDFGGQYNQLVARALLPEDIMEGSHLKYECLQYELLD